MNEYLNEVNDSIKKNYSSVVKGTFTIYIASRKC